MDNRIIVNNKIFIDIATKLKASKGKYSEIKIEIIIKNEDCTKIFPVFNKYLLIVSNLLLLSIIPYIKN
jgi:hypothetical protein